MKRRAAKGQKKGVMTASEEIKKKKEQMKRGVRVEMMGEREDEQIRLVGMSR